MTVIISAFPCLGKTTLTNQNKEKYFDAEIYETRATKGMSDIQKREFFRNSASNIKLIHDTNTYDVIFITGDDRLLEELSLLNLPIIHVLPNPYNEEHLEEYKERVVRRSGTLWYERVLKEDMNNLSEKVQDLNSKNERIYFVQPDKYIEHLVPEVFNSRNKKWETCLKQEIFEEYSSKIWIK